TSWWKKLFNPLSWFSHGTKEENLTDEKSSTASGGGKNENSSAPAETTSASTTEGANVTKNATTSAASEYTAGDGTVSSGSGGRLSNNNSENTVVTSENNTTVPQGYEAGGQSIYSLCGGKIYHMLSGDVMKNKQRMEDIIGEIQALSAENERLSDVIREMSMDASQLEAEASEDRRIDERNDAWGEAIGGGAGVVGMSSGGGQAITGVVGKTTSGILAKWYGNPKFRSIETTKKFRNRQADIQSLKDKQESIRQEMSTLQHRLSVATQNYNLFVTILQTILSSMYETTKSIASAIRY
ncbi:MAG: hypothetical protein LBT64_02945, partial [Puniceicoccales bacterium]|nr:hypothetical protein [Puniceicoccales bacterium]